MAPPKPETLGAPKNPKVGDTYTGASGKVYTWDGSWWRLPAGITPDGSDIGGPGTAGPNGGAFEPGAGGGVFDPKITAIDTTNPNAVPIIAMLSQYLTSMFNRAPDPQRQFTGPMSQLYPRGAPQLAGSNFNPGGMTPGGGGTPNPGGGLPTDPGRRPPVPRDPNYIPPPPNGGIDPSTGLPFQPVDPNRRPPAGPTTPGTRPGGRPTLDVMAAAASMLAPFTPVSQGSTQIRSYQPQYQNQHTANTFDAEALLRSL